MVTGVTWQPYYDLHASTSDGKPSSSVSLHYCANITQSTGEDWSNTTLTLSTANSHALHSLTVPKVDPLRLLPVTPAASSVGRFLESEQPPQPQAHAFGQSSSLAGERGVTFDRRRAPLGKMAAPALAVPLAHTDFSERERERERAVHTEDFELVVDDVQGDEAEFELPEGTVLDKSPLSLAYRVEGKVSLPSDGVAHKVSVAMLDFSAGLKYVCVPRKTSEAFIEGRIKNTSEYELLAGPVSVFMDDSFVTKTRLGVYAAPIGVRCVY